MLKKIFLVLSVFCLLQTKGWSQVKIGDNPGTINAASLVELESTNKSFVFPRVALTDVTLPAPLQAGLLTGSVVFSTTNPTGGSGIGLYLWDGIKWSTLTTSSTASSAWLLTGNAGTNYNTNFLGTTDNTGFSLRTNNTQRLFVDSTGAVAIGSVAFNSINREKFLVDYGNTTSSTIATYRGSINDYLQINIKNTNNGSSASTDYVATADNGTDSTYYIDMGINSSTYAPSVDNFGGPNDGYLYSYSRNLIVGTQAAGSDIVFLTGGGSIRTNTSMRITAPSGNVIIGSGESTTTPVGNILRGPNAFISATNTAGGSLTIQGGKASGNATGGSVNIAGGSSVTGISGIVTISTTSLERMRIDANGNVGIGTILPAYKLQIVGTNPLSLLGVVSTTTLASDSVLTINAGTVKATPFSSFVSVSGNSWLLTGNSGTNPSVNFLGTTDNQSLVFKANNQLAGKIDLPLNNLSLGYQSAGSITTGTNNIFLGYQSGFSNTTGPSNTGVGSIALFANTVGSNNSALGMGALGSNTTGSNNTGIGTSALRNNTTAAANTATGAAALKQSTTGSDNTANGYLTLTANTTGYRNTAIGSNTLFTNTAGYENSANGGSVLYANTTGSQNTGNGNTALYSNTTGNSNTANGFQALYSNTTGFYNAADGYKALYTNTTGNSNTALGYGADVTSNNLTNATAIGYNTTVGANNSLVLGNGANVGIGTSTPANKLEINSGLGGASGLRLKQLPAGAVLFMSSSADVAQNNNNFYFDATNYRLGITAGTSPNSTLQVGGSLSIAITTKTDNYTASGSDHTILCNNTSGSINIQLPNATGITGRTYIIKKISGALNDVVIVPGNSQKIDGAVNKILTSQYDVLTIQSDGTNWYILSNN